MTGWWFGTRRAQRKCVENGGLEHGFYDFPFTWEFHGIL